MLLLALLIQAATPAPAAPAAAPAQPVVPAQAEVDQLAGIATCVAVTGPRQVDDATLRRAGWAETPTTNPDTVGTRNFTKAGAGVSLNVTMLNRGRPGCIVRGTGSYAPLIDAINAAHGAPSQVLSDIRVWRLPSHRIVLIGRDVAGRDRLVMVSHNERDVPAAAGATPPADAPPTP